LRLGGGQERGDERDPQRDREAAEEPAVVPLESHGAPAANGVKPAGTPDAARIAAGALFAARISA